MSRKMFATIVLEVCYFEWLQNQRTYYQLMDYSFRSVLFWMITKLFPLKLWSNSSFRSVLFWMITKRLYTVVTVITCFRSVLFWMITKRNNVINTRWQCFRSMLFWNKNILAKIHSFIVVFIFWIVIKNPEISSSLD